MKNTRTYLLCLLAICLLGLSGQGQEIDLKHFEQMQPRAIGPAGMSGRITSIDVDLTNPEIIYAGAASGGVWKSTNGGVKWEPIFDDQPVASIGAVAVNQKNTDVIWVGTGEGNPRNSANYGAGIFKSKDGGDTWERMGLEKTRTIHRIIVHRDNPDIVFAGAQGSQWGPHPERGVYRTKDGGKSWEKVLYVDENTGVADLVVDPTNPDKLIAAMWEYGRKPWTFNSGGPGSGLYITYDGGDNWKEITDEDGLPKGDLGRIGLAIAPGKPNIVYALIEAKENGLYKSTDGGKKWSLVSKKDIGNRPFYYADIFVDPENENRIYNLWSYVSRSEDGGKIFKVILDYGTNVHPDHHAFWVHPTDGSYLIDGNDGGLNISRDGGSTWRFVGNLPVGQFYHVNHDMEIPYNVGGGMQDNGTWVGPSQTWKSGGITAADWQEVMFGDGFDLVFDPDDSRYIYAMSQGGNVGRVDRETGQNTFIKPVHPDGKNLRFNWNAAIAQDPHDNSTIYFGSQYVHKSTDKGNSWTIISPDLTTNDPEKQKQHESGGLTIDATQAENNTTIVAIAPSPIDPEVIWVGTDDGHLQLTRDGGESWTNLADKLRGVNKGAWIPQIQLNKKNAEEALVVVNDYRRNDFRPLVYHTNNFGQSFRRITNDDQVEGHVWSVVQDPVEPNLLFLGTDFGLYFSLNGGDDWQKWNHKFPSVPVADLKIHPREHDLIIGTFGRAIYILDDIRPLREIAKEGRAVLDKDFALFDAPDAYQANYRSYQGIRFIADGEFVGQNRSYGAMLSFWVKPDKKDTKQPGRAPKEMEDDGPDPVGDAIEDTDEEVDEDAAKTQEMGKKKPKKITFKVVDSQGDTVRTFSRRFKEGLNRVGWNLDADGVRYPSRRETKPDDDPPGGGSIAPGQYTIIAQYGDQSDQTQISVHADPRLPHDPGQYATRERLHQELNQVIEAATTGFDRLRDARTTIDLVNKASVNMEKSLQDSLKKEGKTLLDTIATLEKLYMMPEDVKGIQRDPNDLRSTLFRARGYISDSPATPSQMATVSLAQARQQTQAALDRINTFLTQDFAAYRKLVQSIEFSLFKDLEPVRME